MLSLIKAPFVNNIMLNNFFLSKKKKRNRPSEFEYWEDESYFPGVPVLPVSGFPYKVSLENFNFIFF